ncbi:MAG TPA: 8-amino-7-oxononanoate synthase [Polyangiaceae bacterium]|nr:8-amino-7-oxononanoate synthase [Polyangiaceae bacterium]
MSRFEWLEGRLAGLQSEGLLRQPSDARLGGEVMAVAAARRMPFVDASSNDYLGYGRLCDGVTSRCSEDQPRCGADVARETVSGRTEWRQSLRAGATGGGASRLLGGTCAEHVELEELLANWVQQDCALLFSSGYAANLGLLSSLASPGDVIFSDELNHASIIDGCRLSRAEVKIFPHRDADALRRLLAETPPGGQKLIVTESYFSMDADTPDLRRLRDIADAYQAVLIVDEAHALGVFGRSGAGLAILHGVRPDIVVGTLGKSVGLQGAFVASAGVVKTWLWNRARSFVYSTASTPTLAAQAVCHVKRVQADEAGRDLLLKRSAQLRDTATTAGLRVVPASHGPIVPVLMGSPRVAIAAADLLRDNGILAYPLRPPTVPLGTSRLRLTVSAGTSETGFEHLLRVVASELPRLAGSKD